MVAGGRAAGEARDPLAVFPVQLLDVGLAAHVQPGVEAGGRPEVLVDRADAGHLAIEGDRGHVARVDPARRQCSCRTVCAAER